MKELADVTGKLITRYYLQGVAVETKADQSPVTAADREAEQLMRKMIKAWYPNHGIIGEEFGNENTDAEYVWILDPIDGTKSFVSHVPLFGTLIGLLHKGEPVAGIINNPILEQFYFGDGKKAFLNDKPIHCSKCRKIGDAVMCTSDPLNPAKYQSKSGFEKLAHSVKVYRTWGDCYGYGLLASGQIDIMIDPVMNPWDSLPLIPILRGAGVTVTDYHGNDPVKHPESMAAAAPGIHKEVIAMLNRE